MLGNDAWLALAERASAFMDSGATDGAADGGVLTTTRGVDAGPTSALAPDDGGPARTGRETRLRLLERPFLMYPLPTLERAPTLSVNERRPVPELFGVCHPCHGCATRHSHRIEP